MMNRRYSSNRSYKKRFNKNPIKYWSHSELLKVIQEKNNSQNAKIEEEFVPKHSFNDFNVHAQIKKNIAFKKFSNPTPIQDQAIPYILEGKDLIGIANTGTGKTAAFLIPLINKVANNRAEKVLIVAPTRELAYQIYEEFRVFSAYMGIYAAVCIGGSNLYRQKQDLQRNPNFVIGTPGRLKDLIRQKALDLSKFNNVVLDETDRMVDIGFINEIKYLISLMTPQRQSLFFSATISPKVKEILQLFVKNPVTVSVKKNETADNVKQDVIRINNGKRKIDVLHELLIQDGFEKVLVFGRTKWNVEKLSQELINRGFRAGSIHGDKRQNQRLSILSKFKRSEINILLATDVASRGLDIRDVSHVINYDMPETYEDYIHRIGRTGRGDKKGVALTLLEL